MPTFIGSRGRHASGVLREDFNEAVDAYVHSEEGSRPSALLRLNALCGLLWNCSDIMPASTCEDIGELISFIRSREWRTGHTYAQGARHVRWHLAREKNGEKAA